MFLSLIIFFSIFFSNCYGSFSKDVVHHISEVPALIEGLSSDNTIIFVDIDDTVLIPSQSLGRIEWFDNFSIKLSDLGVSNYRLVARSFWDKVLFNSSYKKPEDSFCSSFKELISSKFCVLGFTRRSLSISAKTIEDLDVLGFDFRSELPSFLSFCNFIPSKNPIALMYSGVMFIGDSDISDVIEAFIRSTMLPVRCIACISSKEPVLREFYDACHNLSVSSFNIMYLVPFLNDFSWDASLVQLSSMKGIISDDCALKMIKETKSIESIILENNAWGETRTHTS